VRPSIEQRRPSVATEDAPTPACPRVIGATADGKQLVTCGAPLPCTTHSNAAEP
jgi:hypothetical protein